MDGRMLSLIKPETNPVAADLIELPAHSRLPRLDLGIDWESPWREFRTSLHDFVKGPRPAKDVTLPPGSVLRERWIRGRFPAKGFAVACIWQMAFVGLLFLPIWGFLPATAHDLAPVQIELTWELPPRDLPPISLRAPVPKPSPRPHAQKAAEETQPTRGADAYNPRQTILSTPVRATHPRQTLIQPDAPAIPPKIVPQLPNIVQWAASQPKRPVLPPTESAPRMKQRTIHDLDAPDVANAEKNPGPINILSTPVTNIQPKLPMIPMSARAAERKRTNDNTAAPAPEINAAAAGNDTDLRRVIALSATPGPPAPEVKLPQGNLAARISISPDGAKPGTPGGSEHTAAGGPATSRDSASGAGTAEAASGASGSSSLPASISISSANSKPGSGGIAPSGNYSERLGLKPAAPSQPPASTRSTPVATSSFDPNMPPEKILSGKEIFTMHVSAPNFTSSSGSWIMNVAQLDENTNPPFKPKGVLSGPVPIEKADPKYPPSLILEHVKGQVILYAIIRKDGSIDSIQLVRGLEPQLDRNAIEALAKWKFNPGTRAGVPVDVEAVVYIPFMYQNP
jgi:TonB family protein